jgi:hypothetical protein
VEANLSGWGRVQLSNWIVHFKLEIFDSKDGLPDIARLGLTMENELFLINRTSFGAAVITGLPAIGKLTSTCQWSVDIVEIGKSPIVLNIFLRKTVFRTLKSEQNPSTSVSSLASDLRATRRAGIRTAIFVTALVSGVVPAFFMMFSPQDSAIAFTQHLQQMWSITLLTYPLTLVVAALTILRKRGMLGFGNLLLTISIVIFCGSVGNAVGVLGGHETVQQQEAFAPNPANAFNAQPVAYTNNGYVNSGIGYPQNGTWQQQPQFIPSQFGTQPQPIQQYAQYQTAVAPPAEPNSDKRGLLLGLPKACLAFFSSYYKTYGFRTFLASVLVGMFAGNTANRFLDHVPRNLTTTH